MMEPNSVSTQQPEQAWLSGPANAPNAWETAVEKLALLWEEIRARSDQLQVKERQVEERLRQVDELRHRYTEHLQLSAEAYLITDNEGIIEEANLTAAKMLGVEKRYLLNKPLGVFVAKDHRQDFYTQLNLIRSSGQVRTTWGWDSPLRASRGEIFVSLLVAPLFNENDVRLGFRWLLRDV